MVRAGPTARVEVVGLAKSYALWPRPQARLRAAVLESLAAHAPLPAGLRGRLTALANRDRCDFQALGDVSFTLERGDSLAVIGKNGSGKSTLLQILAGTLRPTAGHTQTHGRVAALLELGCGFSPEFTGRENVHLNAALLGLGPEEVAARFDDIAAFADIGAFLDRPLHTYSTGMQLRLAFAVAAHIEPDVLLVDEALSVGDAGFQFKCLERMRWLSERGTILVLVSHDMLTVKAFCRQALYLRAGRVVALGDVEQVCERYFQDIRGEQRRAAGVPGELQARATPRPSGPSGFGGPEGRIEGLHFVGQAGPLAVVASHESVAIEARISFPRFLRDVTATLLLLSDRLIPIAGRRSPVAVPPEGGELRVRWSFTARLGPGRYFLTLRLEQGPAPSTAVLIEKQTAALEIEVLDSPGADLLGYFDLGIEMELQAAQEALPR